jgi:hypothetical protein
MGSQPLTVKGLMAIGLEWSEWRLFPDLRKRESLIAPLGPGRYKPRIGEQLFLFGKSNHVAKRMTSLLPAPLGSGPRNNDRNEPTSSITLINISKLTCDSFVLHLLALAGSRLPLNQIASFFHTVRSPEDSTRDCSTAACFTCDLKCVLFTA